MMLDPSGLSFSQLHGQPERSLKPPDSDTTSVSIILVAESRLAYFLKSVLKSPKAAPVLPDVGVLSWAASTAASAPPWSLYETLADILTARQRVQVLSLYSSLPATYKMILNGRLCHLTENLQQRKTSPRFRTSFYTQKRKRELDKSMSHDRPTAAGST